MREFQDIASLLILSQVVACLGGMEKVTSFPPPDMPGEVISSKGRRCGVCPAVVRSHAEDRLSFFTLPATAIPSRTPTRSSV